MFLAADKRISVLEYFPYSPDLVPYDFYLFLEIKTALKGTHFRSMKKARLGAVDLLI